MKLIGSNIYLSILFLGLSSSSAFASGISCSDSSGDLKYTTFASDGGPCCGRSGSALSYKGKDIKVTGFVGGYFESGTTSDSNPNLILKEISRLDMGNSSTTASWSYTNFAMSMLLTTTDGTAPYGDAISPKTVSLICLDSRYIGRPIP